MKRTFVWLVVAGVAANLPSSARARADDGVERCAAAAEKGQALRRTGRLIDAREELLRCAAPECPTVVRSDCARWASEMQAATPSIVIRVSEGPRDITEVRVFVDGTELHDPLDGRGRSLDPGEHVIRAQRRGGGAVSEKVLLAVGEQNRLVRLRFPDPAVGAVETARRPPASFWIVGGLGIATGIGGGIAYALGASERSQLVDTCAGPRLCTADRIDSARTKLVVGDVLAGISITALAVALVLYVTTPSTLRRPEPIRSAGADR